MNITIKRDFTSADVAATAVAKSANRYLGIEAYTYRDALRKAAELGIVFHPNRFGTACYNAQDAGRIREELIEARELKEAPSNLSGYSDTDLVTELRRRGWEVKVTKTTITEL